MAPAELEEIPVEYDAEYTRRMLARVEYASLKSAYDGLRQADEALCSRSAALPDSIDGADMSDPSTFLHTAHYAMSVLAVKNGSLHCPECKTAYGIQDFIPNFIEENK